MSLKQRHRLTKLLAATWLLVYTGMVLAIQANSTTTLAQDVKALDYESLAWAAAAALMGAAARVILLLARDTVVVVYVWRQALRDAVVALVSGGLAYIFIQWASVEWPLVWTRELRMLFLIGIGFSRGAWQEAAFDFVASWIARQKARITGQDPAPPDPPPTVPQEK